MTRICWWLVDRVSRMLEPDEREAVRGDLAESGVTGGQALRDVLGLVVRRQALLWKDWRPWLALVGIVGVVGPLLIRISYSLNTMFSIHLRTNWKYGVRYETGLTFAEDIVIFVSQSLALIAWSWTSGFVLGSLGRGTIAIHGMLFCFLWLFFGAPGAIPLPLQTVVFLVPAIWGVRQGMRLGTLKAGQTILLAATIATMTALATWTGGWWQSGLETWSEGAWRGGAGWHARLLPLVVVSWPVGYLVAMARSRSGHA